jgi:hypothetical protein
MRALVTIPTIIAVPAAAMSIGMPTAPDRTAWDAAMSIWRKAEDAYAAFRRDYIESQFAAMYQRYDGGFHPMRDEPGWADWCAWSDSSGYNKVMEQAEKLGIDASDSESALFLIPSPDLAALRWKLDKTVEADGEIALWCEKFALILRSDFLRLLPEEA